jgi:polysaccharide chain length determinant protein (PEP-CTERM system associated)
VIPKTGLDYNYIKGALRRRLWYVVLPFFVISLATIAYCIKAPKIFLSSALILIQPQEVPTDYVKPTVTTGVQSRLSAITDEVMSRSTLKKIIVRHDLYPGIRKSASIQDAIEAMRQDITIGFKSSGGKRSKSLTSFEISFEGNRPVQVREVTAELAQLFIDYNYRLREKQAAGTTKFLDREMERMKKILRQKEQEVIQFKQKYAGFLPENMQSNYRILSQLQQHLDSVNTALQKTEDRKVLLQTQLSKLETLQADAVVSGGGGEGEQTLDQMLQKLQRLKLRYSERHPDVMQLKALIAKLETEQQASPKEQEEDPSNRGTEAQRLVRVQKEGLLDQLGKVEKEIKSLREAKEKTTSQIEKYRERIESGPKIEQMFVDLRRDYNQASKNYQSLLQKKLQAQLAENLERAQKGEQFKILDQANLPQEPFKPDIPKILGMGLMLALGCGLGLGFLREYLDPTFWTINDVETQLELPVLVSIPLITTDKDRRWNVFKRLGTACALLVMSSTLAYALFILWQENPTLLPIPL